MESLTYYRRKAEEFTAQFKCERDPRLRAELKEIVLTYLRLAQRASRLQLAEKQPSS
jgi:hypothetical protein